MGVISMTPMLKYGYSVRHTMGVIAASGTITQLIPPSLVLVVLADQMGRSVGDMYAGAIGPSIIQIILFCGWVLIVSFVWPESVPGASEGSAHAAGVGTLEALHARNDPITRPDLPCAGHDIHGLGNAD